MITSALGNLGMQPPIDVRRKCGALLLLNRDVTKSIDHFWQQEELHTHKHIRRITPTSLTKKPLVIQARANARKESAKIRNRRMQKKALANSSQRRNLLQELFVDIALEVEIMIMFMPPRCWKLPLHM